MANVTDIKQELTTRISTDVSNKFSLDFSNNCIQSTDASQIMSGIKISGATDVDIKQTNQAIGLCALKTVLDMNILNSLSASAQGEMLDKLTSQTGLGVAVTDKAQSSITDIKTKVSLEAAIDMSKKCLQQMLSTQELKNITIEDSKRINISQTNSTVNQCLTDSASAIIAGTDSASTSASKITGDTTVKGMDPLASIAEIVGGTTTMLLLSLASPILICCCLIFAIGGMGMMGGKKEPGADGSELLLDDGTGGTGGIGLGDAADLAGSFSDTSGSSGLGGISSALSLLKGGSKMRGGMIVDGMTGQILERTSLILSYVGKKLNDFCGAL